MFIVFSIYSWGWRHRLAAPFGLKSGSARTSLHLPATIMTPCWGCVDLGAMLDPSWAVLGPCWGYVELCWDHVGSCSVKIGAILEACWGWTGLCWPILKFCWGFVGPCGVYVGAKFAHLEQCWGYGKRRILILSPKPCSCLGRAFQKCPLNRSILAYLGLCWGYVGVCWGHVRPSWGYVGALLTLRRSFWAKLFSWLHLHFQILLEKALASGLRVSCLDSLSKICLFLSSPQWPAGSTLRAFLLPPVACESQVPPIKGGRGCRVVPP